MAALDYENDKMKKPAGKTYNVTNHPKPMENMTLKGIREKFRKEFGGENSHFINPNNAEDICSFFETEFSKLIEEVACKKCQNKLK